jgi:sigma-B regulation protein RsbU (phosphoserine phosphatase)
MGVIACVHHLPGQYDGESLPIIQVFSEYTSIAIENLKLFNAAHNQAWVSTVLLQVAEATQSITNLEDLLVSIVEILPGLIGVSACAVFLWDPTVDDYFYHTSYGFSELQISGLKSWDIPSASVAIFKNIMENRTPIILNSDTLNSEVAEQVFPDYDLDKDLLILFPLLSQNEINGVMLIDFTNSDLNSDSPQEMWDEKYTLIEGVSRQASIAIENLQLIKSQEEEAYISVALLQVAQAVVSLKHLDEILATIVRITPILAGVKRCIIYIWENKEQVFRQSQYFGLSRTDLALMGQVVTGNEFPFIKAVQQQGRIIHHALGPEEAPASWNEIEPADYQVIEEVDVNSGEMQTTVQLDKTSFTGKERLLIGLPLSVKGENLGVMIIEEEEPLRGFTPVHIREKRLQIVKGITQQAAIAIKNELLQQEAVNSERMERELQLAREIQATFLPEIIPEIPGWDLDARWQPAREVGGDFYDIINLEGHKLGFVIADVADKGMPAALFMTLIRTLIRAAAKERSSPAAVLSQVNELLIPDAKHGMFVTVFYGVISLDTGAMVYANAGHNPPVLKPRSSKQLIELTRTSIALGIFDQIEVEEREISLNPGDWLFLYTDGITEAFSIHSEMFGTERLRRLLVDTDFISSKHLSDQVIGAVQTFIQGAELSDDMTLGVIYRKT